MKFTRWTIARTFGSITGLGIGAAFINSGNTNLFCPGHVVADQPTANDTNNNYNDMKLKVKPGYRKRLFADTDLALWRMMSEVEEQYQPNPNELDLLNVQIFFRHGARTPLKKIPHFPEAHWDKDKFLYETKYIKIPYIVTDRRGQKMPQGPHEKNYERIVFNGGAIAGQLTVVGQHQMYTLGRALRNEYISQLNLLSPFYKKEEVHVQSTNVNRTIHSVCALLSGLFNNDNDVWMGDNVRVRSNYPDEEYLYPNLTHCQKMKKHATDVYKNRLMDHKIPGYKKDREKLQDLLGVPKSRIVEFEVIRDNLTARHAHGLEIPQELSGWIDKATRYAAEGIALIGCGDEEGRQEVLRLSSGRIFHSVKRNLFKSISDDGRYYKLHLYSVHDSTLIPMLTALNIYDGLWPPFAADLRFELYSQRFSDEDEGEMQRDGDAWVRVRYLGKVHVLPGCEGEYCSLDKFLQIVSRVSVTADQHAQLCGDIGKSSYGPAQGLGV